VPTTPDIPEPEPAVPETAVPKTAVPELAFVQHDGDGPPALFIHGYLTGAAYWETNLPALRRVCQPIVIELWGHGHSPSPDDPAHYHPPGLVAAFDRIRQTLTHDRWFVVGHSLGAALAMQYALAHPGRVQGLVVTNSNSGFASPALDERRGRTALKLAERIDRHGMAAFDEHPLNPSVSKRLPPVARSALIEVFGHHDPVGLANMLRWTTPNAAVTDRLEELAIPTLLTWGVFEKLFQPAAAVAKERIPELQVAELQAGHPVNLTDHIGFDRAVGEFISELSGA